MSKQELAVLEGKAAKALAAAFEDDNSEDLSSGVSGGFGVLSFRGSKWRVKHGGEEIPLTDKEGDAIPSLRVVLVKANKNVSKNYYAKQFEEGSVDQPDCYSVDGVSPDPAVVNPVNDLCATCPKNVFGSRITESGKKAKACSDNRRVAVVPEGDLANERFGGPMLLRVPPTSLTNLANYGKQFKGTNHRYNTVVTRVSFDMETSYPHLMFKAARPLSEEEGEELLDLLRDPEFMTKVESVLAQAGEMKAPEPAPEPQQESLFEDDEEEEKAPAPKPKAAPKKAPAKKAEAKPKAEPKKAEKPKQEEPDDLDEELDSILSSLDNLD